MQPRRSKTKLTMYMFIGGLIALTHLPVQANVSAESEIRALGRAIYYEARGESLAGKKAVANVIMNRTSHDKFPDTVTGVIAQKGQFPWYRNASLRGKKPFDHKVHTTEMKVAREVYWQHKFERTQSNVGKSMFFNSNNTRPTKKAKKSVKIGGHQFFTL